MVDNRVMIVGEMNADQVTDTRESWKMTGNNKLGVVEECISRDSGFDFETDEQMSKLGYNGIEANMNVVDIDNADTGFGPGLLGTPEDCGKGDGGFQCGNGLIAKWRVKHMEGERSPCERDRNGNISRLSLRNSLHWEEFFGSSLDLAPTLLGIYDKIASSNRNDDDDEPTDSQSNFYYFSTNDNLEDGSDDQCHSPNPSTPLTEQKSPRYRKGRNSGISRGIGGKMEALDNKLLAEIDSKKRPLSISSMSSSSTSSLPRRRKRPNLSEYSALSGATQLDIEKLDNLLYIDDGPENEVPERSADELSVCSDDKQKLSGGDSDSQISNEQSELLQKSLSFHQSDSSLSQQPINSANSSTADLTLTPDLRSHDLKDERVKRSPSRSSQRSAAMARGASQKGGHYVSYVQRVVTELLETERIYVVHLKEIKEGYCAYLRATGAIPPTDLDCLFGNIVQIYNFSCGFLGQLEACGLDPVKLAECFVKNNTGFVIYAEYCTNYPSAVGVLTRVMRDARLSEVFKQRQAVLAHSLPLGAYLLKPVQRVLKYHLLLQNILKHYSKEDAGYEKLVAAHDHMTQMSLHINEMKRKHEHAIRVQEIQSQLEEYEGEDFTQLGELALEGSFRMFGAKASRQMFLFEKGVIIAKRKEDGMLGCKAYIPCATLMLVESIPKEPLNFQILPFDNPRGAHTIHARNLEQKRKWCQEIKRLILESYASKIPDNVKDLVIEKLGKSKEEDALAVMGGTESGNKSHVTTPEYLEKRLRSRRKSGTALLQDILKPQRNRKFPMKQRTEPSSPSVEYTKEDIDNFGFRHKLLGFARGDKSSENQENKSPRKTKRTVSIQRSQSFQSNRNSLPSQSYRNEQPTIDAMSMDNLSQSAGSAIRTDSFRKATQVSPIKFELPVDSPRLSPDRVSEESVPNGILSVQRNLDNIPPSVRKSIENIDSQTGKKELSLTPQDVFINKPDLNGSYLEELGLRKKSRYASMPVLNNFTPPSSPKIQRLHSDRSSQSPMLNNKLPVHHAKRIDVKPYFSYSRDKINEFSSQKQGSPVVGNHLSKDQKQVNAFHDAFANLKKPQDSDKNMGTKSLSLTQPKPFASSLRTSANLLSSQARLNKWGPEKFTKGSLSDLSHLKEDPWIRNKQRSFTESRVTLENHRSPIQDRRFGKPTNKQISRLSLDASEGRGRVQSADSDSLNESSDNLDWIVYANRNSIPVSAISVDDMNRKFKYCTPPRGSMEPPPCSKFTKSSSQSTSGLVTPVTPNRQGHHSSSYHSNQRDSYQGDSNTGDSSISLSANTTSSDTCSSPDILKDCVFDDSGSAEKMYSRDRMHVSRSFSTPTKQPMKSKHHLDYDRPASADVLGEVSHLEESDKLLAEMEHYMQRSTSSSGSLSSNNNRFPTSIPHLEPHVEHRHTSTNKNRDSIISTGSTSSYDSTGDGSSEPHSEEGLVDHIKSKFTTIASKFTGKKLHATHSGGQLDHSPSSPKVYRQEDHPSKLSHFSFRSKPGIAKSPERDLPTILRETELGSEAIGSRMADTDLDDYATFAMPKSPSQPTTSQTTDVSPSSPVIKLDQKKVQHGKYSSSNLSSGVKPVASHSSQSQSETRLFQPNTSLKSSGVSGAHSDSAFSIQSFDIESSTPEDSPRTGTKENSDGNTEGNVDNFYERRLSDALGGDDAFRDSAVYCDDVDTASSTVHSPDVPLQPLSPKINIRNYVQQFEDKTKPKVVPRMRAVVKEPSAVIKQRIESLQASTEYRSKSSSVSRSISRATSRTHSRCSSRASSEEKHLTNVMLQEYIDSKFPVKAGKHETEDDSVFHRGTVGHGRLRPAFSMGRLDSLKLEVDNMVIMKGWVKELIEKFQK